MKPAGIPIILVAAAATVVLVYLADGLVVSAIDFALSYSNAEISPLPFYLFRAVVAVAVVDLAYWIVKNYLYPK